MYAGNITTCEIIFHENSTVSKLYDKASQNSHTTWKQNIVAYFQSFGQNTFALKKLWT
jgi:hypothetical protein